MIFLKGCRSNHRHLDLSITVVANYFLFEPCVVIGRRPWDIFTFLSPLLAECDSFGFREQEVVFFRSLFPVFLVGILARAYTASGSLHDFVHVAIGCSFFAKLFSNPVAVFDSRIVISDRQCIVCAQSVEAASAWGMLWVSWLRHFLSLLCHFKLTGSSSNYFNYRWWLRCFFLRQRLIVRALYLLYTCPGRMTTSASLTSITKVLLPFRSATYEAEITLIQG